MTRPHPATCSSHLGARCSCPPPPTGSVALSCPTCRTELVAVGMTDEAVARAAALGPSCCGGAA